jgi:hypothetical protein
MKLEEVVKVLEIYEQSQHKATPNQVHKLLMCRERIRRLTFKTNGKPKLTDRQQRALLRAFNEALAIAHSLGAASVRLEDGPHSGSLVVVWSSKTTPMKL